MTTIKITRTDRRILAALDEGDATPSDLAETLGLDSHQWLGKNKLRRLLAAEVIRVSAWVRNTDGPMIPVYSITPGNTVKRPRALGRVVCSRRYRARLKENGGEQYLMARNSLAALVRITGRHA